MTHGYKKTTAITGYAAQTAYSILYLTFAKANYIMQNEKNAKSFEHVSFSSTVNKNDSIERASTN